MKGLVPNRGEHGKLLFVGMLVGLVAIQLMGWMMNSKRFAIPERYAGWVLLAAIGLIVLPFWKAIPIMWIGVIVAYGLPVLAVLVVATVVAALIEFFEKHGNPFN